MRNVYGKFRKIKRNRTSNILSIRKRETSAFENLKRTKKKKRKKKNRTSIRSIDTQTRNICLGKLRKNGKKEKRLEYGRITAR